MRPLPWPVVVAAYVVGVFALAEGTRALGGGSYDDGADSLLAYSAALAGLTLMAAVGIATKRSRAQAKHDRDMAVRGAAPNTDFK